MKLTRFTNLLVIGLALTFAVVGCKKNPSNVKTIFGQPIANVPDVPQTGPLNPADTQGTSGQDVTGTSMTPLAGPEAHQGWPENREIFKAYTVHFAFDSSAIGSSEKSKVASVADYLKANGAEAVRVEGHCDERGTEEYNRALGERRALAVREELIRLGIDAGRVDTISFGEDQPADQGHNEAAWKQNRRGEFILLSPPK